MEKDKSIECLEKEPLMRIRKLTIISLKRCFLILNRNNSNTSKCLHFIYRLRKKCRKEKQMTVARVPFMHPVYAYTSICFGVKCFDSFYIRNTFLYKQNDKGK